MNPDIPYVLPDGTYAQDDKGKPLKLTLPDTDSGVFPANGSCKAQVNIWCWPIGSGEVYGYRKDAERAAGGPRGRDAKDAGRQAGRRVERVRDHDAGRPTDGGPERHKGPRRRPASRHRRTRGPIALQHHGGRATVSGTARPPSCSLRISTLSLSTESVWWSCLGQPSK